MQLLQFPLVGNRGQALEEWERLVRQYEAQSSDTLQDTIKAAILAHTPQDPEWRRHVGLNATRLQGYDALKSEWKTMHQAYRQWGIADGNDTTPMEVDALMKGKGKNKGKGKGKENGKDKGKIAHIKNVCTLHVHTLALRTERSRNTCSATMLLSCCVFLDSLLCVVELVSNTQPLHRSGHGCTVVFDRDPPV